MIRCGERNERFINGSAFGDGSAARIFWALHLAAVRLLGLTRRPGVAGKPRFGRSLSLPFDALSLAQGRP